MAGKEFICVVLAAGKGTRLKSDVAKVLHRAGGKTLVESVVRACKPLGGDVLAVVGHQAEDVRANIEPLGVKTVLQRPQCGTGHAVLIARNAIDTAVRTTIVLPGDAPLIRTRTLEKLVEVHHQQKASATILTAPLHNPAGYGRIVRDREAHVTAIVEEQFATDAERAICEINSGIYCFTLERLWPCLAEIRPDNAHRELYLTGAIAELRKRKERVAAVLAEDAREILGCNTRRELAEADRVLRARKAAELMDAGVTIYLPETALIDLDVQVGADSVIEPGVQLLGNTNIGAHCRIQSGSILTDTALEHHVLVRPYSVMTGSRLSAGAIVGPFAHLREGSDLRAGARVGNFVEVKKSVLGEGVKAMHLTYLGDAIIGEKSNIGAGTITCNYDGLKKSLTKIGERVFVGSDSALVAPVTIGDGAYIAAGSTITDDVPADALAIARGRQMNKPGWAAARRSNAREESATPEDSARGKPFESLSATIPNRETYSRAKRKFASHRRKKSRRK